MSFAHHTRIITEEAGGKRERERRGQGRKGDDRHWLHVFKDLRSHHVEEDIATSRAERPRWMPRGLAHAAADTLGCCMGKWPCPCCRTGAQQSLQRQVCECVRVCVCATRQDKTRQEDTLTVWIARKRACPDWLLADVAQPVRVTCTSVLSQ
jgi:hypothetical protein